MSSLKLIVASVAITLLVFILVATMQERDTNNNEMNNNHFNKIEDTIDSAELKLKYQMKKQQEKQKQQQQKQQETEQILQTPPATTSSSTSFIAQTTTTTNSKKDNNNNNNNVVAICLFGLVKNLETKFAQTYRQHLYEPLWKAGFKTHTIIHTYRMTRYINKRNSETGKSSPPIDQNASLQLFRQVVTIPPSDHNFLDDGFEVHFSLPEDADNYFPSPLEEMLTHGDPWPENALESFKYYLRQQFSLLQLGNLLKEQNEKKKNFVGAVFTRPDMMWYDDLDVKMFKFIVGFEQQQQQQEKDQKEEKEKLLRIALPTWFLYHNTGFNDRLAYGNIDTMLLYASRGKFLVEYSKNRKPHAEAYLRDFLCENKVEVNLVRTRLARVRLHGGIHPSDNPPGLKRLSDATEQRYLAVNSATRMPKKSTKPFFCPYKLWKQYGDDVKPRR